MHPNLPTPNRPAALVLMARAPRPGYCKTRLCPPLSPQQAAELYHAFLVDLAREVPAWDGPWDLWLAWSTPDAEDGPLPPDLADLFGAPWRPLAQRGEDLTTRMDNVFEDLFDLGYRRVVMRNTDSPHLPRQRVSAAFTSLADRPGSVVLGPDLDGGYYLIGLDRPQPGLLPQTMSTASVLDQTLRAAGERGLRTTTLDAFLDVDTPDDLAIFWLEFEPRSEHRPWATWQLLSRGPLLDLLGAWR